MEAQDLGNYNFGYIGRAAGYSIEFLSAGAGANQLTHKYRNITWCFTTSLCDDPRDSCYIRLGAIAYDKEH